MRTTHTITTFLLGLALLGLAVGGPACGGGDNQSADAGSPQDGGDPLDLEGCEHMTEGPFLDVTAGSDAATAGEVKSDHHAYRVAVAAAQAGYVTYAAGAAGDHVFFLDANAAFAVQDDQGAAVAVAATVTDFTACTAVNVKHTVALPSVGTYYLVLGPEAAATTVSIVIEAGE
jgi:hypothetical protein